MRYGTSLMAGEVGPTYQLERPTRAMNCIEKIVANKAWTGAGNDAGIASVTPGDQVLCACDFRGMHEYTAGMVMDLYRSRLGARQG